MLLTIIDDEEREFIQNLYLEYKPLVAKKIREIVDNDIEVEDLINTTFLKLINKVPLLKTFGSAKTIAYVALTAKRVAINFIKHRDIQNQHFYYGEETDISNHIGEPAASSYIIDDVRIQRLQDAVHMLPEKDKNLLYFKYYLEMTDMEIAEEISINPNSVREYLSRARRKAKVLMEKEKNDGNKERKSK